MIWCVVSVFEVVSDVCCVIVATNTHTHAQIYEFLFPLKKRVLYGKKKKTNKNVLLRPDSRHTCTQSRAHTSKLNLPSLTYIFLRAYLLSQGGGGEISVPAVYALSFSMERSYIYREEDSK